MENNEKISATNTIENNMSFGSVPKRLILFAMPFLISNVIQSLYNVADMIIVGQFSGAAAMSGVNIGGQITFLLTNITIGLCTGATVLIGQYVGADERKSLREVISTIITLLLIVGVVATIATLATLDPILRAMKTPLDSYTESRNYLWVTLTGIIFIFGYNALAAILRGLGDSKHPLLFVAVACVTNVLLDLLLVAGMGLGAFGAGLATVVSQGVSMILCAVFMKRNNIHFDFKPKSFRINMKQARLIFKIGLPASIQNGVVSLSFLFLTTIINTVGGMTASAAVGAVGKFNSFAFMPTAAISGAVSTMAAQNIGANRMDRAVSATKIGILISVVITYAFFAFTMLKPEWILRIFSTDETIISAGIEYIHGFAYDLLLIPIMFNITGFLLAGGHSMFTMIVSLLSSVLLRVPACYILGVTMNGGLLGVGLGAPVASLGSLIVTVCYLLTGKWKVNVARAESVQG